MKVQKSHCFLKLTVVPFENDIAMISVNIWPECIDTQLYHIHTTGESDKILSKKTFLPGEKGF